VPLRNVQVMPSGILPAKLACDRLAPKFSTRGRRGRALLHRIAKSQIGVGGDNGRLLADPGDLENTGGMAAQRKTSEVFGVSNEILPDSYVDRGHLDDRLRILLGRPTHIALRGVSKCGKSWLRQKLLPDALTVQCRYKKTASDIYVDALSQLGVRLEVERSSDKAVRFTAEGQGQLGLKLIAEARASVGAGVEGTWGTKTAPVGRTAGDLTFVAEILKVSGRRLVIEDFHYLAHAERTHFAFDLKALWDFGVFALVIGVWSESNFVLSLNPDLTGRVEELAISWSKSDLERVLLRGGLALNLVFTSAVREQLVELAYENAGVLQKLALQTLDEMGIAEAAVEQRTLDDVSAVEGAALHYAEQLNPLYQQFARRVAEGIRHRHDSTAIYPHTMAAILAEPDAELLRGVNIDRIHQVAHARQPRIQKGNLRTILQKFARLQVDEEGRGLVLAFNDANDDVTVVDRQLLLYRRYATVRWPWEDLIREAENNPTSDPEDAAN